MISNRHDTPREHVKSLRLSLTPVEVMVLLFFAGALVITEMFGRPFYFRLDRFLGSTAIQLNWLLPCFAMRILFSAYRVRPAIARHVYLGYFLFLTIVFMGSSLEETLSQSVALQKTALFIHWMFKFNVLLILLSGALVLRPLRERREETLTALKREGWDILHIVRLMASLLLCFAIYSNLKAMVHLVHPGPMDSAFYALDRALFLGGDPFAWIQAHTSPALDTLMERCYFFFFFFVPFGLTGAYLFGSVRHFERTLAAFTFAYILGVLGYFMFPAMGPAFCPDAAHFLQSTSNNEMKQYLMRAFVEFRKDPQRAVIVPFNGLAAFPSLHCAHSLLFMYYLGKKEIWMPVLLFVPLVLLLISTVWLGWHWAVDLLGGAGVAAATIWYVKRLYPEESKANLES